MTRSDIETVSKPKKKTSCVTSHSYSRCAVFGVALVSTEIYDSKMCIHGPIGCTQVVREAASLQNREYDYCQSGMSQRNVIFGGEDVLIAGMLDTMNPYERGGPKILATTCAPEIIGDNVSGIIARINPKLPVVMVSGGGFRGNQYRGINDTLLQLLERFSDPHGALEPGLVNLIGDIGGSRQWRADVREMNRLLSGLGLEVNQVGCDSTLDNIRRASHAEATILITPEIGGSAAEYLLKKHARQVVSSPLGLPLGLRGTEIWLRTVGEQLKIKAEKVERVLGREEEDVRISLKVALSNMVFIEKTAEIKRLPVAVVAEGISALSWCRFLHEELEMVPQVVGLRTPVCKEGLDQDLIKWLDPVNGRIILDEPSVADVYLAMKERKPGLVLGSSLEADMVRKIGCCSFMHIVNPNTQYVPIIEDPLLGYRGLLRITQKIMDSM